MEKIKLPAKCGLDIVKMMDVAVPNASSYRKKYPHWREYDTSIYLNDYRILGVYSTPLKTEYSVQGSGRNIKVKEILKALGLKTEQIDELFEFVG